MGPTASGKSAFSIHVAQHFGGVILNADAMQCYRGLPLLTAQPNADERAAAPHRLYDIWEPFFYGHAALWQARAAEEIRQLDAQGTLPILVGGTGMYVKLLSGGLASVPPISSQIRAQVRGMTGRQASDKLQMIDPVMSARLKAGDTQRVKRALEVMLQTGKSLALWQQENAPPLVDPDRFVYCYMAIQREEVYARIDARFDAMLAAGVMDEVERLETQRKIHAPESDCPLLKAHGFPELSAYLRGEMSYEAAILKAKQHTRNYAKRQMTWIRNQLPPGAVAIAHNWPDMQGEIMLHLRKMIDRQG